MLWHTKIFYSTILFVHLFFYMIPTFPLVQPDIYETINVKNKNNIIMTYYNKKNHLDFVNIQENIVSLMSILANWLER